MLKRVTKSNEKPEKFWRFSNGYFIDAISNGFYPKYTVKLL